MKLHILASRPFLQFILKEHLLGLPGAIKDDNPAIIAPIVQYLVDDGAQRRKAQPARRKQNILPPETLDWKTTTEGSPNTNSITGTERVQCVGERPDPAHTDLECVFTPTRR
jgi:hypothetical protein